MAIDSAAKRLSALDMDMPFAPAMPAPDGTVALTDMYHLLWLYTGIAGGAAGSAGSDSELFIRRRRHRPWPF